MTDRLKGVYVAFEKDIREEDAEFIIKAIEMIKGVQAVSGNVVNPDDYINRMRIKSEFTEKIIDVLKEL